MARLRVLLGSELDVHLRWVSRRLPELALDGRPIGPFRWGEVVDVDVTEDVHVLEITAQLSPFSTRQGLGVIDVQQAAGRLVQYRPPRLWALSSGTVREVAETDVCDLSDDATHARVRACWRDDGFRAVVTRRSSWFNRWLPVGGRPSHRRWETRVVTRDRGMVVRYHPTEVDALAAADALLAT